MGDGAGRAVETAVLFTDIEGSTRLWDEHPDVALAVLERHDRLLSAIIVDGGGELVGHTGDGVIGRFPDANAAATAAARIQIRVHDDVWPDSISLKIRVGIHVGDVLERGDGLFGWALNYCSRVMDVGHGGQVLLSETATEQLDHETLDGVELRDLGSYRLRDVPGATRLTQLVIDGLESDFPPLRKAISTRRQVPRTSGVLVGRGDEHAALVAAVGGSQLVAVAGPPGVGKTRLAADVARSIGEARRDVEVLWTDLGGADPDAAISTVMTAHSISLRPGLAELDSLVAWLSERCVVLVLDGCDLIGDSVRRLADAVLEQAPSTTIITTSRHTIGRVEEVVVRLAPLDRSDAVELFLERARCAGALDITQRAAEQLVDLLDGLPYAIEIAAASAALYSSSAVLDALRSRGLSAVAGDDERFRAVRHAVGLALDALDPASLRCLEAATVFTVPFEADAFHAVCDPDGDADLSTHLATLVGSSLLQPVATADATMYQILDPVRSALEPRVDPAVSAAARNRQRDRIVSLVDEIVAGLRGPSEQLWMRILRRNIDEVRAVFWNCLESGDHDTAAFLASSLWEWAYFRFNSEYFGWGAALLERADEPNTAAMASVHGVVALGCWFRDEPGPTDAHAREALRRERDLDAPFSLPARIALMNAAVFSGASAPPAEVYTEIDAYYRESPFAYHRMNAEAQNAIMATWLGHHAAAEHLALKALKIGRESGNPTSIAFAEWALGQAIEHDAVRAEQLFDDALRLARDVDNHWIATLVQISLASSRRRTSGPLAAVGFLVDLLDQLQRSGHWAQLWSVVRLVALCADDVGAGAAAYELSAAVDAADMTFPAVPADAAALSAMMSTVENEYGEAWAHRTSALVATWTHDDAVNAASAALASISDAA